MALWKPFRGSREALDDQALHDGYVYFCTNDGSLHFDFVGENGILQRKQINDSMLTRLETLETIINNSPLVEDFNGAGILDAGTIMDASISVFNIIDPGRIIEY